MPISEKELENTNLLRKSVNSSPDFKLKMSLCNELNLEIEKLEKYGPPRGREIVEMAA